MLSLGLSLIVGKDEAFELDRCLKSVTRRPLLDEIVVTMTFDDPEVETVARKYTSKIHFFKWIKDFSAARNFCLDKMTSDFVLWLDADDIVTGRDFEKLQQLKPSLDDNDVYMLTYIYFHTDQGQPYIVQPRERIFRRISSPPLRWYSAVHEGLLVNVKNRLANRRDIAIDHYRMKPFNADRNIEILREQHALHPDDARYHFYLGKDTYEEGLLDQPNLLQEGRLILEDFVRKNYGLEDDRVAACLRLAQYYLGNGDIETAKNYALHGLAVSNKYAELYLTLADVYKALGNVDMAIQYNEEALTRNFDAGFAQVTDQYKFRPAVNLSLYYYWDKHDKNSAFKYNKIALQYEPNNDNLIFNRNILLGEVTHKISVVWFVPVIDLQNPTVRIRYYNIHKALTEINIPSMIVTSYYNLDIDYIIRETSNNIAFVFIVRNDFNIRLASALRAAGKKVVIDICESVFYNANDLNVLNAFDVVTCCSTHLAHELKSYGINRTRVIKDAVEFRRVEHKYSNNGKLRAVYAGMGGNSFLVTDVLRDTINATGYELVVLSEWDNATKKWNIDTWHEDMNACDVALCPQRVDIQPAKSNVKVTTAMSLGLPVIASPILAYKEIINDGINGFLCETKEQWYNALVELKDEHRRQEIGQLGIHEQYALAN